MKPAVFQKFSAALAGRKDVTGKVKIVIFVRVNDKRAQYNRTAIVSMFWANKCANLHKEEKVKSR